MRKHCPFISFLCILLLAACRPSAAHDRPILYVYSWEDYFDSQVIDEFQRKYNCYVDLTYFSSNMEARETLANPAADYDIATPSSYVCTELREKGLLHELDHSKIPNLKHLDPQAPHLTDDPQMRFAIPYTRTICGIGYNRNLVKEEEVESLGVFSNPRYAGRMTMIADMRETIGIALKHLGYSVNSTNVRELAAAESLLTQWGKNLSGFIDDSDREIVNDSNHLVNYAYNGNVAHMRAGDETIGFVIPREGSVQVSDDFIIPAGADNVELAHAFINHFLTPAVARKNITSIFFHMYIPEAMDDAVQTLADNPAFTIPEGDIERCETLRHVGGHIKKYERLWRRVVGH